jgi:branched-subunit amino acid aminotransferase/4-amino-4-deoxychorismate lyase
LIRTANNRRRSKRTRYAEDRGGVLGIGLDAYGKVSEQATACVAFLGPDGVLRTPKFDGILEGTTLRRIIEKLDGNSSLNETSVDMGDVFNGEVELCDVTLNHVREAVEIISFGGGGVLPIVRLAFASEGDGNEHPETRPVGNGKPGKLFEAIQKLVSEDYESSSFLDDVPYSQYK